MLHKETLETSTLELIKRLQADPFGAVSKTFSDMYLFTQERINSIFADIA